MKTDNHHRSAARLAPAIALAASITTLPAFGFEFSTGELQGYLDTTISYGASWRVEDRCRDCVGKAALDPLIGFRPIEEQVAAPGRFSVNNDSGNLNYDDGDLITHAVALTSELSLTYRDFGGFFRFSSFYDFENTGSFLAPRDGAFGDAREFVGEDTRLLDAFLFYDFSIGNNPGTVRLGRQVVNWGESAFIQGGINIVNPVDVSRLRVAGAELRQAFLPVDSLWASLSLTENLSVEAVVQFEFEQIDPDPSGSYFGTNDFGTPGGDFVMLGFGLFPEQTPGLTVPRRFDRSPDESGQFGVAFRYYSPELNDTEFGFYYMRYHSRLPLLSGIAVTDSNADSARYFVEYPEDIEMFGLSWNTEIGGWAFAGEISYRDNQPLQIDDVELLFAALSPLNAAIPAPADRFISQLGTVAPGQEIRGWEEHEFTQLQFSLSRVFGSTLGSDQAVFLAEFGVTQVWDLPSQDVLRYQGPGTDTGGGADLLTGGALRNPVTQATGFPDKTSWGYRLLGRLDYNSAFGSAYNLFPQIAFNHDVSGTSPGPGGAFIEDRKSLTLSLGASYLEKWRGDVGYTRFYGAGLQNLLQDRDFVSASISYAF
ncbi:MAG: DUF1302 domain-containing protein [Pseudomonadota bacterium]